MGEKKGSDPVEAVPEQSSDATRPGVPGQNGEEVKDFIGRQLKAMFDEVVNQPVPDRFADLLDQLDRKMRPE
jgi:hypothetical protein